MIKGFVFDLDGVLTDTAEYHYLAWKALAEEVGIDIDRTFNEQLKGISRLDSLDRILKHGGKEAEFTKEEKEQLAHQKNEQYKQLIEEITPEDILEGIPEFLAELKAAEMKLAIASASKNAPVILEKLGIADQFMDIVNPAKLKKGKPDPEIFLTGADLLGLEPKECTGIEDAEAGIQAINDARMFSVGVGEASSMKEADYHVENTSELHLTTILDEWKSENN